MYLAPTLFVLLLLASAVRLRRHIEPSCPGCDAREWRDTSGTVTCACCGWSMAPRVAFLPERHAA